MTINRQDLLIVGAGPAGMAAAIAARRYGLSVVVVDERPTPGGMIWHSFEKKDQRHAIFGSAYSAGGDLLRKFRACGAIFQPGIQLWQMEKGFRAFVSDGQQSRLIEASALILATGAMERPVPFPGWTLPGVLSVGAAQILLKSSAQIPDKPVWIAGSGPLPLLYMAQLVRAGGKIAGYLDTTPAGQWRAAVRYLPAALSMPASLLSGLALLTKLRTNRVPVVQNVRTVEALGKGKIEKLRYSVAGKSQITVEAEVLLFHEGLVPNLQAPMSMGCQIAWNDAQDCFQPVLDSWGESTEDNLFIAGDGAGIAGAEVAQLRGELAAIRVAIRAGRISSAFASTEARPKRRSLRKHLALRQFLDRLYKVRAELFSPPDQTVVCRCESVTASEIKAFATIGRPGPNQIKAATRAGMGPCQGRQCGYSVTRILSVAQNRRPSELGLFNVRPPLKPVTLGEVASLQESVLP